MTRPAQDPHTQHASETRALECPVCSTTLTAMTTGGVTVEVCAGGCGGMWFDWFELDRVDEKHETGEKLLEVERDPTLEVAPQKRIFCPLDGEIMMRHFRSVRPASPTRGGSAEWTPCRYMGPRAPTCRE